ncbi:hypothetical protein GCM10028787_32960 [Brachybacterium horti]
MDQLTEAPRLLIPTIAEAAPILLLAGAPIAAVVIGALLLVKWASRRGVTPSPASHEGQQTDSLSR